MTPFYHPTSILVLDDDPLFLESLDFQFSDEVSCQTFTRPDAALSHLREQATQHPNFARYFRDVTDTDAEPDTPLGDRLLQLQLSELRSVIEDRARQQRISVAVVDYDMPKMTGVEFCRAIRDLPVKTILLTGKAGLETAISAFNEGLIDCFLQKQDQKVTYALRREIRRLQDEYFAEISAPIDSALALQKQTFLSDPNFVALFKDVADKHDIVEHYVCAAPPGVIMRDADGNESFLFVTDAEGIDAQCEAAESRSAPAELLRLLRTRKAHAWFPTADGRYHPDYQTSWTRYTWPAESLSGAGAWSYSLVRHEEAEEQALRSRSA